MAEQENYAGMPTWAWDDDTFITVDGTKLIYTLAFDTDKQIDVPNTIVHPYTAWTTKVSKWKTVNGIRTAAERRTVAVTPPTTIGELIARGHHVQLPKKWRNPNQ